MRKTNAFGSTSPSRRGFLKRASAAAAGSWLGACSSDGPEEAPREATANFFTEPLGAELYTVRNQLPGEAETTLQRIADIGYQEVEGDWPIVKQILPVLKKLNLRPVSVSIDPPLVTGNWDVWDASRSNRGLPPLDRDQSLDEIASESKQAGADYFMFPYLMPDERGDLDSYRKLADQLNQAGEIAAKSGIRLCYHQHAFEFEPHNGVTPFDILVERLDPAAAAFEVDVFWVSVTGNDPVEVLRRVAGRVPLIHLKDKAKGAEQRFTESPVPPETFEEVGDGSIDFVALLRQAADSGVEHYFVEQDQTPGDPVESLRKSYEYLRSLEL